MKLKLATILFALSVVASMTSCVNWLMVSIKKLFEILLLVYAGYVRVIIYANIEIFIEYPFVAVYFWFSTLFKLFLYLFKYLRICLNTPSVLPLWVFFATLVQENVSYEKTSPYHRNFVLYGGCVHGSRARCTAS